MLPAIFDGVFDPLPMYQLATLCRMNYIPTEEMWANVGNGLRRHLQRVELFGTGGYVGPRVNILELADHRVVIVAGSSNLSEWINNSRNLLMATLNNNAMIGVASAFWSQAQAIAGQYAAMHLDLSKPTIFCGHSLGGAIATCLHYMWPSNGGTGKVATVSFGSPKVGTKAFVNAMVGWHGRCVFNLDIVTSIPLTGIWLDNTVLFPIPRTTLYAHGGDAIWISWPSGRIGRAFNSDMSGPELMRYFDPRNAAVIDYTPGSWYVLKSSLDHKIWNYCTGWRRLVEEAPRYVLESFDTINTQVNAITGETWPTAEMRLEGAETKEGRLPEDPVEVAPFPAAPPVWNPANPDPVVPVLPQGVPPPPRFQRRRTFNFHRNI